MFKKIDTMATNYIFFTLILFGNLFIQNFAQAKNDSNVSIELIEKILLSHNTNLSYGESHKVGLNQSYYECDCGWGSQSCHFNFIDEKICECKPKYSQKGGQCEECDCVWGFKGCHFDDFDQKVCDCERGYAQNGERCELCDCGVVSEGCSFENGKKICSCFGRYRQNYNDKCVDCYCGIYATDCRFNGYKKECFCENGYIEIDGECKKCDCGLMATSCELTFDKYTRCKCKPGYVAERTTWEMNEKCLLPGPSGWKVATYIESVVFGIIILICACTICTKKMSS